MSTDDDVLSLDWETASQVDLKAAGAYRYAMHPSTEILMGYWAINDEPVQGWFPGEPFPERVIKHVVNGGRIDAANATFERLIWWYVLPKHLLEDEMPSAIEPALEQFHCTLYKARCNNMPASLDKLARCLGTFNQKHANRGAALIKQLCILDEKGRCLADDLSDAEYDALWDEFCDYCAQDVRAERDAGAMMREPTNEEWEDYWVTERINDRGVRIDPELARGAVQYAQEEEAELVGLIKEITAGAVEKARGEKLKAWVMERLTDDQLAVMVRYRGGEKKYSLDKAAREELLSMELAPDVAEVLDYSDMAQKSSVSKFKTMLLRADPQTKRVYGAFMANGAPGTGRFSSRGLQVHNFPRDVMDAPAEVRLDLIENIEPDDIRDYYELQILEVLARMLRPALVPASGRKFLVSDWSAIEGRIAPWLTKSRAGDKKLQLYIDGVDTYITAAQDIYRIPYDEVDKEQRQVGKVAELALQFGGGENAFLGMARNYGVAMSVAEAKTVKTVWREANSWATQMWERCETAAFAALASPGQTITVGRVRYFVVPGLYDFEHTLFCELPCGRVLTYPDVRVSKRKAPWGDLVPTLSAIRSSWTPKADAKEWPRGALYGGLLVENIVQGTAASLLRWALRECDFESLPVVLDVHDEIVLESPDFALEEHAGVLEEIMNDGPAWAEGLPLKATVETMERYGK